MAARDTGKLGEPHCRAVQVMKTMKIDPEAAALLRETFGDVEPDEIAGGATETLIVCGREDRDNGSPVALADLLPNGRFAEIPGTHMSCVTMPELGNAMADFLNACPIGFDSAMSRASHCLEGRKPMKLAVSLAAPRSEERRVEKAGVSTCRSG